MKRLTTAIILLAITAGLFSFFSKAESREADSGDSPILGMVLLDEPGSMEIKNVVAELRDKWKLQVEEDEESDNETAVLVIDGYNFIIGHMPMPIPGEEIERAAEYNYFWEKGVAEATRHKAHIILSLINAGKDPVKENMLYTKVAASVMNNSKASGIYIGGRSLLLKKEFYLSNAEMMTEDTLPLLNWVYFGLRQEGGRQSIYTYGLSDFNKKEMEIVNSRRSLEELSDMMSNLAHYVILGDVSLKSGETIGASADQKLKIKESRGKYLEGRTLKIAY